ncbi:thiol:disulfide interchange protein DsbG [Pseudomonas sp. GD03842]|uniref:thiol:disulfide interchange protein DsbG n=1 Tax=unclassified Pseudomonas TaxID=196821 RepID=UPI000D38CF7E|nr:MULTISPECIES: thiol:disulfide interchange protein DsbG [unclassified Pseudomonas]MDH0748203.1 thiol:disulfide interchange protein DsbG [Pseudomonas sp. GD03842]RAU47627.1 thiol:disulfide interchange protein DsbG [Pseudomonas sp. RIT 409]RAU52033.1 thiol:disulfide interchange protein DsbG [Pseudomonas sp. RIT 412]
MFPVAGLLTLSSALALAEDLPAPIKALEAKGATIRGAFDAPGGLKGYAAEYQKQGMALYLTPDGKHVLAGNLFDEKGEDLSEAPLQKLVYEPMTQAMWSQMENSTWIPDGAKTAPRVIYLFSDANCPYCNLFWEQARPWVKAGKVQLRHIMVGVIREDSAAKAATLLSDANPEVALQKHEQAGKSSTLKAMATIPKDIQAKLDANMKLMDDMGLSATPSIFYKDVNGHVKQQQGAPRPDVLAKMMGPK